jgi:hypothetical protein
MAKPANLSGTVNTRASPGGRPPGATIAASIGYRNLISGQSQAVKTYVYSTSASLEAGKTVASVTLPAESAGDIGIFAIGAG